MTPNIYFWILLGIVLLEFVLAPFNMGKTLKYSLIDLLVPIIFVTLLLLAFKFI